MTHRKYTREMKIYET